VNVEDELGVSVGRDRVRDRLKHGKPVAEGCRSSIVGSGEKHCVGGGTSGSNSVDDCLQSVGPSLDVEIVGFIHEPEDNLLVVGVESRHFGPKIRKLGIRRATLTDNSSIPSSVIVDIDDDVGAKSKGSVHDTLVGRQRGLIQGTSQRWLNILPSERNSEYVETFIGEVGQLRDGRNGELSGVASVGSYAKVKACEVDSSHPGEISKARGGGRGYGSA